MEDNGRTIEEIKKLPVYQPTEEEVKDWPESKKLHKVTFFVEEMNVEMAESLVQDILEMYELPNPRSFMVEEVDPHPLPQRLLVESMEIDTQSVGLELQDDRNPSERYYTYINKAGIMRIVHGV